MAVSFIRTIILYMLIILALRVMGKRQISELDPAELVISLLISDLAAVPMQDAGIPLIYGIIPIATLIVFEVFASLLSQKSRWFRSVLNGHPVVIIEHGKLNEKRLKALRLTDEEVIAALRQQNVGLISDVKYGVFETNGQLSVVLYPPKQAVTAEALQLDMPDAGLPVVVISDGKLMENSLHFLKKDAEQVRNQLRNQGITLSEVLIMTMDDCGNFFIQQKEANS